MNKPVIRMQAATQTLRVAGALAMLWAGAAQGAEWYVATNGNHTAGTDWNTAYTNIQYALDKASTGDTIYLAGQTFAITNQLVWTNAGVTVRGGYQAASSADKPGVSDPDQWPTIITRSGAFNHRILYINGADDSTLEYVTMTGGNVATGGCLRVVSSQRVLLSGCNIETNGFSYNSSGNIVGGAGIYASSSELTLTNCIVRKNIGHNSNANLHQSWSRGGGIWSDGILTIHDSLILDNAAICGYVNRAPGGGIYFNGTELNLKNVLFAGNRAYPNMGGGLHVAGGTVSLQNCSVVENISDGIRQAGGTVTVANSIVYGNWNDIGGNVTLSYSNIGDTNYGGNNISADPLFEYGYRLADSSPCIGAGSDTAGNLGFADYTTRTDGAPYSDSTNTVNLGWHYPPGTVFDLAYADLYVSPDGNNGNDGTEPGQAFRTVTKALSMARDGTRIHVAAGTYTSDTGETFPLTTEDKTGVQILGDGADSTILDAVGSGTRVMALTYAHRTVLRDLALTRGETYTGGGLRIVLSQGILLSGCAIENNTFSGSVASWLSGQGIYASISKVTLTNCIVKGNTIRNSNTGSGAYVYGGGVYSDGVMTIRDSQVRENFISSSSSVVFERSRSCGGGIYFKGTSLDIKNVLISGNVNRLGGYGGGLHIAGGTVSLENCTVADNAGHGIYREAGSITIKDSIICGNWTDIEGDATVSHSNIGDTDYGINNISADPIFEYGYRLADGSPCIGAGSDTAGNLDLADYTTRTDGAPYSEPVDTVNMGWHYLPDTVFDLTYADIYVAEDGSDANAGTSPDKAFRTVTKALSMARDGTRIHVAAGTYTSGTGETFPLTTEDKTGVQILGDGGDSTILDAVGSGTRVMALAYAHRTVLRDLALTRGKTYYGGGLHIANSQGILLSGCVIENNTFSASAAFTLPGAGIYATSSELTLTNCIARGNAGTNTQDQKDAYALGGGIYSDGILKIFNSRIFDNSIIARRGTGHVAGGGIYMFGIWKLILKNTLLAKNEAHTLLDNITVNSGGVYFNALATADLVNVTVADNEGGFRRVAGTVNVLNSIIRNNNDDVSGDPIYASYSNIETGIYINEGNNISDDPMFLDPSGGNFRLQHGSPAIDAGANQPWMLTATDLDGRPRILMGNVDMGCYEMPPRRGTIFLLQ